MIRSGRPGRAARWRGSRSARARIPVSPPARTTPTPPRSIRLGRSVSVRCRRVRLTDLWRIGASGRIRGCPRSGRPAARQGGGTAASRRRASPSAGRSATSGVQWDRRRRRYAGKLHNRRRHCLCTGRPASPRSDRQRAPGAAETIGLRRFASSFPIHYPLCGTGLLLIRSDRSPRPWQLRSRGPGPTRICGIGAPAG